MRMQQAPTKDERRAAQEASRLQKSLSRLTDRTCELLLVRHGETDWNAEHRLQGQLEPGPSLNAQGRKQAGELATRLAQEELHAVYTSDLARTLETVEEIKKLHPSLPVTVSSQLRERCLGCLEGLKIECAQIKQPEAYAALRFDDSQDTGGIEPLIALRQRITDALENIAEMHPRERVLVITHGGALRVAYQQATGVARVSRLHNCALCIVQIDASLKPPAWAVVDWGNTSHLSVEANAFGGGIAG